MVNEADREEYLTRVVGKSTQPINRFQTLDAPIQDAIRTGALELVQKADEVTRGHWGDKRYNDFYLYNVNDPEGSLEREQLAKDVRRRVMEAGDIKSGVLHSVLRSSFNNSARMIRWNVDSIEEAVLRERRRAGGVKGAGRVFHTNSTGPVNQVRVTLRNP